MRGCYLPAMALLWEGGKEEAPSLFCIKSSLKPFMGAGGAHWREWGISMPCLPGRLGGECVSSDLLTKHPLSSFLSTPIDPHSIFGSLPTLIFAPLASLSFAPLPHTLYLYIFLSFAFGHLPLPPCTHV